MWKADHRKSRDSDGFLSAFTSTLRLVATVNLPEISVPLVGKVGPWQIGDTVAVPACLALILVDEMCAVPAANDTNCSLRATLEEMLRQEVVSPRLLPWQPLPLELNLGIHRSREISNLIDVYSTVRRRKIHQVALNGLKQGFALTTELGPQERGLVGTHLVSYFKRVSGRGCLTSESIDTSLAMLLGSNRMTTRHETWIASQKLEAPCPDY